MPNGVEFEEQGSEISIPNRPAKGGAHIAAGLGFGRNPGQANAILIFFAAALIGGSFFMLASAVPKSPPPLGADVLNSHESVGPNYH